MDRLDQCYFTLSGDTITTLPSDRVGDHYFFFLFIYIFLLLLLCELGLINSAINYYYIFFIEIVNLTTTSTTNKASSLNLNHYYYYLFIILQYSTVFQNYLIITRR